MYYPLSRPPDFNLEGQSDGDRQNIFLDNGSKPYNVICFVLVLCLQDVRLVCTLPFLSAGSNDDATLGVSQVRLSYINFFRDNFKMSYKILQCQNTLNYIQLFQKCNLSNISCNQSNFLSAFDLRDF